MARDMNKPLTEKERGELLAFLEDTLKVRTGLIHRKPSKLLVATLMVGAAILLQRIKINF